MMLLLLSLPVATHAVDPTSITISTISSVPPIPSFVNDIVPLLTKSGCNQGSCHGKNDGRNGFKLSLRGYAPDWDWERLVKESRGRRLNLAAPDQSLLLKKASGAVPHGGGALIVADSRGYRLLRDWIASGAPGISGQEPKVTELSLSPEAQTLALGEDRQLTVIAKFSDGAARDVTWLTQFFSNDGNVIEVNAAGNLRAARNGETSIRAHFQSLVSTAVMTVPLAHTIDSQQYRAHNNFVDEHIFRKLEQLRIPVSPAGDDHQFARRVFLDLTGTLPTADELRAFAADAAPDKRAKLIDALLERPEFVDYWTLFYSDLFQNRRERDHDVRGAKDVRAMQAWLRSEVAANRPWDQLARTVLTSAGSVTDNPAVGYYVVTVGEKNNADESEVVASVAQAFIGTRIGCAQCHNHPLERYTQDDYYHFAAFFAAVKMKRAESKNGGATALTIDFPKPQEKISARQPRTGQMMEPQALDRVPCALGEKDDPRVKLADWMTGPNKEQFAGAMVNRLWKHFLGTGMVEPVDDLRASNPPSHPELWNALVKHFIEHNYDLKSLMRAITNSRTYQLSADTVSGNGTDLRFYSHFQARRLPAEVLLDAVCQSTERPEPFAGYAVGTRAIQLPEPKVDSYFLSQFGRSDRVTACACERKNDLSVTQLLHLQCGNELWEKVVSSEGRLGRLLKEAATAADEPRLIDELFLYTLSRLPQPAELQKIQQSRQAAENRDEFFQDLLWALLNSKEFSFNH